MKEEKINGYTGNRIYDFFPPLKKGDGVAGFGHGRGIFFIGKRISQIPPLSTGTPFHEREKGNV